MGKVFILIFHTFKLLFQLGGLLDEAEYQRQIVPCVVKLFASNDRATRVRLLQQLELFIGKALKM